MRIAVIQQNVSDDKARNINNIEAAIERAVERERPDFVVLPEMMACISGSPAKMRESAEPFPGGPLFDRLSGLARRLGIYLHAGSAMEAEGNDVFNCSLLFNPEGILLGKYRKIHRFDVVLADGTELKESKNVARGEEIVCVDVNGLKVGMSICYDIRFPELFRALVDKGAQVIVVPSAFTFQTGADHWEILLRARAIETQCYIVAPGQVGSFDGGKYMNFGHSIIVDPWGQVVAQVSSGEGSASAVVDPSYLAAIRNRMPLREHRVL